jgi:hypothetical protein
LRTYPFYHVSADSAPSSITAKFDHRKHRDEAEPGTADPGELDIAEFEPVTAAPAPVA